MKKNEACTLLYISSLDFRLTMPKYQWGEGALREKKNFSTNDYYFVILKYKTEVSDEKIDVMIEELTMQCDNKEFPCSQLVV
jgi:hypothetical protein